MAQVAEAPAAERLTADEVVKLRNEAQRALTRAQSAAGRYDRALAGLPVRELLRLARAAGVTIGHGDRSKDTLLHRLRLAEASGN